jgi:beta-barrel assembly-enhancing protease
MKTWFGSYFTSFQEEPVEATVLAYEKNIAIGFRRADGTNSTVTWDIRDIGVAFDHSLQATKINRAKEPGTKLIINGTDAKNFIEQLQTEHKKPWHKKDKTKDWGRNLLIFLGIFAVLVTTYFLIVPWLSEKFASTVSVKTEEQFGNAVYDALALSSQEDKAATIVLNDFFKEMKVATPYNVRITVVKSDIVNAFALPGGNIVVYTGLLKELNSYPELAALLSHEFIHVNNKHSTKSIFRQLGSRIFLSLLFGKFGSVTSVMIDQADKFKSLKYSRGLEKEADIDGLAILKERKIDPEGFVSLFKHLRDSAPTSVMPEFLGSHPDIDKRVDYIRNASVNVAAEENVQLKTIFEKLK